MIINGEEMLSTKELAEYLKKEPNYITFTNKNVLHLTPAAIVKRENMYSKDQVKIFEDYYQRIYLKYNHKKSTEEIELNAEEHPLVKDNRFLKLSFFPCIEDITPLCFQSNTRRF